MQEYSDLVYDFTAQDVIDQGRTKYEYIQLIKEWLPTLKEEKLVPPAMPDQMIVQFLLSCNNDVEFTMKTIVAYCRCKKAGPEIHDNRDIWRQDVKLALNTINMASIPVRTDENYVIHYFNINDTNYHNFELTPIMKISYMLMDITHKNNPPDGLVVVIDMKGIGLLHMTKLKVGAIKKYLQFLQEGFPMQLKVIHILNAVYFFDKIMAIVKVFMKSELMELLQVHPPMENAQIQELIPKKCLPKDYGGDLPSVKELNEITEKQLKDRQKFWQAEEKLRKDCQI